MKTVLAWLGMAALVAGLLWLWFRNPDEYSPKLKEMIAVAESVRVLDSARMVAYEARRVADFAVIRSLMASRDSAIGVADSLRRARRARAPLPTTATTSDTLTRVQADLADCECETMALRDALHTELQTTATLRARTQTDSATIDTLRIQRRSLYAVNDSLLAHQSKGSGKAGGVWLIGGGGVTVGGKGWIGVGLGVPLLKVH